MLITDYLDQLDIDKDTLYNNLVNAGISASEDETFTTLCPKVGEFADLKDELKPVINIAGGNITDEPLDEYPDILEESLMNIWNNGPDIIFNNLPHVSGNDYEFNLQNTINARMKFNSIKGSIFQNPGATPTNEKPVYSVTGDNDITIKQYEESEEEQVYNFNLGVENLYNPKKLKNGYLPNTGAYPTTSGSWPNSKYLTFPIKAHQVLYIKNVNDVNNVASLKCIDKTTNEVVTYITTQENNYFTSTGDFSAGFDGAGTVTAKVDFIVGLNIKDPSLTFSVDMTIGDQYISENPIELCKIGTYQDYIYKQNNKWYVHKEIGKLVLNGSETWTDFFSTSGFYRTTPAVLALNETGTVNGISNYYQCTTRNEIRGLSPTSNNKFSIYGSELVLVNTAISTVADFQTWLSTHNTVIYYILNTATDTIINDVNLIYQLEDILNKASSYDDNTYLISLPIVEGEYPIINITALKESE